MVDITIEQAEVFLRRFRKVRKPQHFKTDVQLARSLYTRAILQMAFLLLPLLLIWVPFVNAMVQVILNTEISGVSLWMVYLIVLIPGLGFSYFRARRTSDILILFESQGPQQIADLKPDRNPDFP